MISLSYICHHLLLVENNKETYLTLLVVGYIHFMLLGSYHCMSLLCSSKPYEYFVKNEWCLYIYVKQLRVPIYYQSIDWVLCIYTLIEYTEKESSIRWNVNATNITVIKRCKLIKNEVLLYIVSNIRSNELLNSYRLTHSLSLSLHKHSS